jgi:hypothetical protein
MSSHSWENVNDYPGQSTVETPYGTIQFDDGVQTWVNPAVRTGVTQPFERKKVRTAAGSDDGTLLRSLRSEVKELKQQNRALNRRNAELRERSRARDEQGRKRQGWRAWRFLEGWVSKRRGS